MCALTWRGQSRLYGSVAIEKEGKFAKTKQKVATTIKMTTLEWDNLENALSLSICFISQAVYFSLTSLGINIEL